MNILDKTRLLQTSILSTLIMGAAIPAYAQVTVPDEDETETTTAEEIEAQEQAIEDEFESEGDEVVVTGSRLRRNEFTSASPLQVIDGELSRDLGLVDAADLLGQTTVVQGQQITTSTSTSAGLLSDSGPGSATASLRGLNPGRTLVLVDGRRLAPAGVRGVPSAPDLNLIPGTLIERVDVLLDGASSVYGSDAVAGVVNYQLRRNFEGLQLDAYATMPELDGNAGHQEVFSATAGVAGDRGFMSLAVEHSRTEGYNERALEDFYAPYGGGCVSRVTRGGGGTGTLYEPDLCTGSFGAGSISSSGLGFLAYQDGANIPGLPANFAPVAITAGLIQPDNVDGQRLLLFPEELDAAFAPDFQRTSIFAYGEYDTGFYGDMTAYFEASHAMRETETNTAGQGAIEMPEDYLFNPFGSASTVFFQSRFINDTNVAQTRLIGGLKGELPFMEKAGLDNWNYDTYVSYSKSSGQDSVSGIPFFPRLEQTISNTRFDPTQGPVCDSRSVPGEGQVAECRPLDFLSPTFLFSGEFDDPLDTEYLFPNRLTDTVVEQTVYSGYINGDLFEIPWGGAVQVGFGGEHRTDRIETRTSLAGDFLGFFNDPGSNGERKLREVFGEIEIPLLVDQPLVESLSLNLAGRYTEESNFGSAETYSIKGVYAPTDWLSFRATYGTSFRAPNLGEQFGGRVTGFADPSDPCRTPGIAVPFGDYDNDPSTPDTREYVPSLDNRDPNVIQNCLNGGGPFGLEATDPFSLGIRGLGTQNPVFLGAPTRIASGSNPDLLPETSDALSIGGTFDQRWTDAFDLRVAISYFEITIDDEVDSLTANTIVNRCYNSPGLTDQTCQFITRDPRVAGDTGSGEVSFVSALNQNLGQQVVEGIDYNAEFGFDFKPSFLDSALDYRLIARATQSLNQTEEQFVVDGILLDRNDGEYGNPEWRITATNTLRYKDFSFLWQTRYLDSMVENYLNEDEFSTGGLAGDVDVDPVTSSFSNCVQSEGAFNSAGDFNCFQADGLDDYFLHSASVAYSNDTLVLRFGVNNVFDKAPPLTDNNNLANLGGIGYDIGGRTYFANISKKF